MAVTVTVVTPVARSAVRSVFDGQEGEIAAVTGPSQRRVGVQQYRIAQVLCHQHRHSFELEGLTHSPFVVGQPVFGDANDQVVLSAAVPRVDRDVFNGLADGAPGDEFVQRW